MSTDVSSEDSRKDARPCEMSASLMTPEKMKALQEGKELLATCDLKPADVYQFEAFANHIKNGGVPRTNQMCGLLTAIGAIAAIDSLKQGKTIDIDPAWYTFDFEVPTFYEYEFDHSKYDCKEEPKEEPKAEEKKEEPKKEEPKKGA